MPNFAVVAFDGTGEVSLVPSLWLYEKGTRCWWPPYKDTLKISRCIKAMSEPKENWTSHFSRVLCKCDDYSEGRLLAKRAENTSDIQSEGEYGRGLRIPAKRPLVDDIDSDSSVSSQNFPKRRKFHPSPPRMDNVRNKKLTVDDQDGCSSATMSSRSSSLSEETTAVLRAVAKCEAKIEAYSSALNKILSILSTIKQDQDKLHVRQEEIKDLKEILPTETYQEFEDFENRLTTDVNFENVVERRLHMLGGANVKAAVKYMVDECLSNGVQTKFNWEGRVGWKTKGNETKKPFKTTRICYLITNVLLERNHLKTNEDEVARTIMVYLRNAGDRCGGRIRRLKMQAQLVEDDG